MELFIQTFVEILVALSRDRNAHPLFHIYMNDAHNYSNNHSDYKSFRNESGIFYVMLPQHVNVFGNIW